MTITTKTTKRPEPKAELILANWRHELDSADLYYFLAERERDVERAGVLREMAAMELKHAAVMKSSLEALHIDLPPHRTGARTRVMKLIAKVFGPGALYPLLQGMEISGTAEYAGQDEATAALAGDERAHARV